MDISTLLWSAQPWATQWGPEKPQNLLITYEAYLLPIHNEKELHIVEFHAQTTYTEDFEFTNIHLSEYTLSTG